MTTTPTDATQSLTAGATAPGGPWRRAPRGRCARR